MDISIYLSNSRDAVEFKDDIPDGISVHVPSVRINKGFGMPPEAVTIIVSFAVGVPASVVGNWLYAKFIDCKSQKISIDRKEITLEKGEITKIIIEKIETGQ